MRRDNKTDVARSVPFDNSVNDFDSNNVQGAIEETKGFASPGFIESFPGNNSVGSWAEISGVPSNRVGLPILQNNPELTAISVYNENVGTFTIEIFEHDGTTFTSITTVSVTSARGTTEVLVTPETLTQGKELAVQVQSGSIKNGIVSLLISGDTN